MTKRVALIDGYGFVFRAYHSLPPLTRGDGTPVGAVYGFTNMLIKLLAGLDVSHAAVVFDSGSKTFRNEIYDKYKANRPPCPEDLKPQFPIVREAAEAFGLLSLEKIGFEADDLIATAARKFSAEGFDVLIVSSDKDLMQLVNSSVHMYDAMKNRMIGEAEVKEKFFVAPEKVIDVLSLMGDSSDNVPGVKGIGPKTAAELLDQFGTLENIFKNLDAIKQDKRRQMLRDGEENAYLSKRLVSLADDVDLPIHAEDLQIKALDPQKLLAFLQNQGFRSLETRIRKEFGVDNEPRERAAPAAQLPEPIAQLGLRVPGKKNFSAIKKTQITDSSTFDLINTQAISNGFTTIDFHHENELKLVTISTHKFSETPEEIFYFEVAGNKKSATKNEPTDLFSFHEEASQSSADHGFSLDYLKPILENPAIKKIFFDAKSFLHFAEVLSYEDVSLIYHLLNSAIKNDLRELIDLNLSDDVEALGFGEIFTMLEKKNLDEVFVGASGARPHEDRDVTRANAVRPYDETKKLDFFYFRNFAIASLYQIFSPKIFAQKLSETYFSYELPTLEAVALMEKTGIKVDLQKLHQLSTDFGQKINELTKEIFELAGQEFNIASPKQLGEILFEKLGLESSKKSKKTGALSTGHAVLEELAEEGHAIASKVLEFRKFSKLKSTYTDALPKEINEKTGRIHSNFSTISTISGRFSSNNPNLQNIPVKSAEGRKIRECFIAEKNHLLISADYSQIELRVIAHMAEIENLKQAFREDKDIHQITASQVFNIPESEIGSDLRSKAKAINFGIIYGISAFGLAKQLGISRQDAAKYIESYLHAYPGIDEYMRNTIEFARQHGFITTFSGRKCFINSINDKNPMIRAEAERLAINAPIQGSAADIVKKAMVKLNNELSRQNLRSKIVLQVHDELVVEAPENEVERVSQLMKSVMENAVALSLPLKVDVGVKQNWE
jgi:DNA polymerase-1